MKFTTLLSFALLFFSATLVAQDQRPRSTPTDEQRVKSWLTQHDKNKDGKIAEAESSGLMKRFFARNDLNKDGILDREELTKLAERLSRNANRANSRQQTMSTEQLLKLAPDDVKIEADIAYRPGDSKAWRLDLAMPKQPGESPRPAIVFIHGGGWRNGDKRTGTFLRGAISYAQKGYVCITINYRLTGEAPFPACVEDSKCAVRWLRANAKKYNVDPNRIGGYGNSAGAHLVSMLGLVSRDAKLEGDGPYQDQSSMLKAVCCSAPPTDFVFRIESLKRHGSATGLLAGPEETLKQRAKQASPITYVHEDAPPFFVIHGTADRTVDVVHGDRFVEALKKAKAKDVTYLRIEGAGHGVFNQHAKQTQTAMEAFFKRTIGGGSNVAR